MQRKSIVVALALVSVASVAALVVVATSRAQRVASAPIVLDKQAPAATGPDGGRQLSRPFERPPHFVEAPPAPSPDHPPARPTEAQTRQLLAEGSIEGHRLATAPGANEKRLQRLPHREALQTEAEEAAAEALSLSEAQRSALKELRNKYFQERRRLYEDNAHADRSGWSGEDERINALGDQLGIATRDLLGGQERFAEFKAAEYQAQRRIVAQRRAAAAQ
jgi:hypothetical protein